MCYIKNVPAGENNRDLVPVRARVYHVVSKRQLLLFILKAIIMKKKYFDDQGYINKNKA